MVHRRVKAKGILEVINHALGVSFGSPLKNLVIGLRLLDARKVAAEKIFRSRYLLDGEALSLDQVKYVVRVFVHNNQVIKIACHI